MESGVIDRENRGRDGAHALRVPLMSLCRDTNFWDLGRGRSAGFIGKLGGRG
jgi:hypothetical protein